MNTIKSKIFILAIIACAFGSTEVIAKDYEVPCAVSPLIIDERGTSRDIFKHSITLTNITTHKVYLYPTVNNIIPGENGGIEKFVQFQDSDRSTSLANWIEITRGAVELLPGESSTVELKIQVHMNAKPGMYHARISFPDGLTRGAAEQDVGKAPHTTVNLQVTDTVTEFMQLKKFVSSKPFYLSLPADFSYELENVGNKDLAPRGEIIIYDRSGREVKSIAVNPEGEVVEPQNIREFYGSWQDEMPLGRYKALLNINYGDLQRANINDTIFITVIPLRYILIASGAFVLLVIMSVWRIRKRRRKKIDQASLPDESTEDDFIPSFPQIKKAMYKNPKTNELIKERTIEQELDIKLMVDDTIESVSLSDARQNEKPATLASYDLRPPAPPYAVKDKIEFRTPQVIRLASQDAVDVKEPILAVSSESSNKAMPVFPQPKSTDSHIMDLRVNYDVSKRMDLRKPKDVI